MTTQELNNLNTVYTVKSDQILTLKKISGVNAKKILHTFQKSSAIITLLLLWEALPTFGVVDEFLLPKFSSVIKALIEIFASGEMFRHIFASLGRSLTGFVIAISFSIPVGILMGWYKRFERIVDPLLQACRSTSTLALYPVFISFFGLSETAKVSIIIWGTIWPVLLNTISGVKGVDPLLIKAARSMGISNIKLFYKVVLPMASPSILTGLRLSSAVAILMLVAAEMLGADRGLGFMIFYYQERYAIPLMFAGIISISALGLLINFLLVKLEKKLTVWKEKPARG